MKNKEVKVESFVTMAKLNADIEDVRKFILTSSKNKEMPKKLCDILLTDIDIIKEYIKE